MRCAEFAGVILIPANSMFRLDAKSLFLTYPHCDLSKDEVLAELLKKPIQIKSYCIARELHEDGTPHIHALILLELKKNTTNPKFYDILEFHGNYQSARKVETVYEYITKSDPSPLSNMDPADLKSKSAPRQKIAKEIINGLSVTDAVEKYPQLLFGFTKLQQDLKNYQEARMVFKPLPYWLPNEWGLLLPYQVGKKKRHYWIYSTQPNRGKTTWAKRLAKEYGAHIKSGDFTYWNLTGGERIIILDEYNVAGLKYHVLNQMADGLFEYRIFMGGVRRCTEEPIIIVLSNQKLEDLYPHMSSLLLSRFNIKCVD